MALEIQGLRPETKETLWTFFPKHHVPFSLVKPSATCCVPGNQRHKAFDDSSRSVSFKERRSSSVVRSCGHGCFAEHGWAALAPNTEITQHLATYFLQLRLEKLGSRISHTMALANSPCPNPLAAEAACAAADLLPMRLHEQRPLKRWQNGFLM